MLHSHFNQQNTIQINKIHNNSKAICNARLYRTTRKHSQSYRLQITEIPHYFPTEWSRFIVEELTLREFTGWRPRLYKQNPIPQPRTWPNPVKRLTYTSQTDTKALKRQIQQRQRKTERQQRGAKKRSYSTGSIESRVSVNRFRLTQLYSQQVGVRETRRRRADRDRRTDTDRQTYLTGSIESNQRSDGVQIVPGAILEWPSHISFLGQDGNKTTTATITDRLSGRQTYWQTDKHTDKQTD